MTCALNTAKKSYPFPKERISVEDDELRAKEIRKAYQKGRIDILCSLVGHEIISLEIGAYMAGMNKQNFENALSDWQYDLMEDY